MVLAFAGVLAVGLSSCGKKEVSSNHVQSVTSETGAETSISEGETPDLSEEQPEQVELPESEEVQGDISQNTEDTQTQESEQEATQDNSSQEPAQSAPVSYADRQEIYLDGSWQYADHSAIHWKQCQNFMPPGWLSQNNRWKYRSWCNESNGSFRRHDI